MAVMTSQLYQLGPSEGYEWLVPRDPKDYSDIADYAAGRRRLWSPLPMRILELDDRGRRLRPADFPWVSSAALGLRRRAREAVGDLLAEAGEFLPVAGPADTWLFIPSEVADLDETRSDLSRLSTGKIAIVRRYVLSHPIPEASVFRVRQQPTGPLLASKEFVEAVVSAGLVGLRPLEADDPSAGKRDKSSLKPASGSPTTEADIAWIREGLCQAIRRLADDAATQLSWLAANGYPVMELGLDIHDLVDRLSELESRRLVTDDQASTIRKIAELLSVISGADGEGLWTEAALGSSPVWAELRNLASTAHTVMCRPPKVSN